MKRIALILIFAIVLLMSTLNSNAQVYDSIVKQFENEFEHFRQETERVFQNFVEQNDKKFVEHLESSWEQFEAGFEEDPDPTPKPVETPVAPVDEQEDEAIELPEPQPEPQTTEQPPDDLPFPPIQPEDDNWQGVNVLTAEIVFFGTRIAVDYDAQLARTYSETPSGDLFARYWEDASETTHYPLVNQLKAYKNRYNLNDWAYYLLVRDISREITQYDENTACMLQWFLLNKSRYKVKTGYRNDKVHVLLGSSQRLYGMSYYTIDGLRYYVTGEKTGHITSYEDNYADAQLTFDFAIRQPISLNENITVKTIDFTYRGTDYQFPVSYNANLMDLLATTPHAEIPVYFNSVVDETLQNSLNEALAPLLEHKTEAEAVGLLLAMVQKAFDYKTDPEQFGREKFFYAEEVFHYPFSDCEDRSVLFAYLVGEFTGLKVIALEYPGHLATAVRFSEDVRGDYLTYEGEKYIICDPTYVNAPVGMCMPDYKNVNVKVIEFEERRKYRDRKNDILAIVEEAGGHWGSNQGHIAFDTDGNAYITAYFSETIRFQNMELTAKAGQDVLVAKLDLNNNVVWAKQFGNTGSNTGLFAAVDRMNQPYIAGIFEGQMTINNEALYSKADFDVFVAKLSPEGEVQWSNQFGIDTVAHTQDYIFVGRFGTDGQRESTVQFYEMQTFDNYGIAFDDATVCFVTVPISGGRSATLDEAMFASGGSLDFSELLVSLTEHLKNAGCNGRTAGLLAFTRVMDFDGSLLRGEQIQTAINTHNSRFAQELPALYRLFDEVDSLQNVSGIVTLFLHTANDLTIGDVLLLKNGTQMTFTNFEGGEAQVNFLSGAYFFHNEMYYPINSILFSKNTAEWLLNYSERQAKITVNLF